MGTSGAALEVWNWCVEVAEVVASMDGVGYSERQSEPVIHHIQKSEGRTTVEI